MRALRYSHSAERPVRSWTVVCTTSSAVDLCACTACRLRQGARLPPLGLAAGWRLLTATWLYYSAACSEPLRSLGCMPLM